MPIHLCNFQINAVQGSRGWNLSRHTEGTYTLDRSIDQRAIIEIHLSIQSEKNNFCQSLPHYPSICTVKDTSQLNFLFVCFVYNVNHCQCRSSCILITFPESLLPSAVYSPSALHLEQFLGPNRSYVCTDFTVQHVINLPFLHVNKDKIF